MSLRDHPIPPPPDPEPTGDPTGGNTPVPAGEGGNTPVPAGEGGNTPTPVGEGGNDPVPVGDGGGENTPDPVEEGGNDPTPVGDGGGTPTPVEEGGGTPVPAKPVVELPYLPTAYPIPDDPSSPGAISPDWISAGRGRTSEPGLDLGGDRHAADAGTAGSEGQAISATTGDSDRGGERRPYYDLDL